MSRPTKEYTIKNVEEIVERILEKLSLMDLRILTTCSSDTIEKAIDRIRRKKEAT